METSKKPTITINAVKRTIDKDVVNVTNLTFSYNKKEDRILFVVNHSDIQQRLDFFVTRRMMLKLLDAFDNILINECDNGKEFKELYNNQQTLAPTPALKKVEANSKNKVEEVITPKVEVQWEKSINTNELNFTKTKEDMLLDTLSYTVSGNTITLKFLANNKVQAVSNMSKLTFQRTLSSMMRVIPFLDWGISPHILD